MTTSDRPKQCHKCLYCAEVTYIEKKSLYYCSLRNIRLRKDSVCRHFAYPGIFINPIKATTL